MSAAGPKTAPAGDRPLAGATVVVTRPQEQAASLVEPLEALGAEVLLAPVIRIVPRPCDAEVADVIGKLATYQLVVFTSANAVRVFLGYLQPSPAGAGGGAGGAAASAGAHFGSALVAAVGPATAAALEARGVFCDLLPDEYVAEGLVEELERRGAIATGTKVLIPRAREARNVLPDALRARGAHVDVVPVYDTLAADRLAVPAARLEAADYITFTSSSSVRSFAALMQASAGKPLEERLSGAHLCSIGPITSGTLRELGLPVAVEACEYTAAGLVAAIVRHRSSG